MNQELFNLFFDEEHNRGTGGVLFIKDYEYSYLFPREFNIKDFTTKLQDILDEDEGKNIFFVIEKDNQLHIMSHSRKKILFDAARNALNNQKKTSD
jgi:hypothetical protein